MSTDLKERVSVLVCSCDAYEDLWYPFFKLYKKYWTLPELNIYLNTESKDYVYEGLSIIGLHPENKAAPYGERMINALSAIKTEYVILFLDDFFLRERVDETHIKKIIQWMDEDKNIVCFNQDCLKTYADWEVDRYPGYRRLPCGTDYTLNMQVAVWRREKFLSYWRKNVSPWEWELYCNAITYNRLREMFFCVMDFQNAFCRYGHRATGDLWGVFRGKWVVEDVAPLFEKENIQVDFSKRGIYCPQNVADLQISNSEPHDKLVFRRLGAKHWVRYGFFCIRRRGFKKIRTTRKRMFYHYMEYLQEEARKEFFNQHPDVLVKERSNE